MHGAEKRFTWAGRIWRADLNKIVGPDRPAVVYFWR